MEVPGVSGCIVLEGIGTGLPSALLWEWRVCMTQNQMSVQAMTVSCLSAPKVTRENTKSHIEARSSESHEIA